MDVDGLGAALGLSAAVAAAGWRGGHLTGGGALAAVAAGTAVLGLGGWPAGWALVAFFVTSSLWTRWAGGQPVKPRVEPAKGGRRDAAQVLANGAVAAGFAAAFGLGGQAGWAAAGVLGAIATAAADTWAAEIGLARGGQPRLITGGAPVPPGTSGAVSPCGTAAGVAGATAVVAVAAAVAGLTRSAGWLRAGCLVYAAGLGAGVAGMVVDSLLGATLQGGYRCDACGAPTERPVHRCGRRTRLVRGVRWLGNDGVNLLATAAGGGLAAAFYRVALALSGF